MNQAGTSARFILLLHDQNDVAPMPLAVHIDAVIIEQGHAPVKTVFMPAAILNVVRSTLFDMVCHRKGPIKATFTPSMAAPSTGCPLARPSIEASTPGMIAPSQGLVF